RAGSASSGKQVECWSQALPGPLPASRVLFCQTTELQSSRVSPMAVFVAAADSLTLLGSRLVQTAELLVVLVAHLDLAPTSFACERTVVPSKCWKPAHGSDTGFRRTSLPVVLGLGREWLTALAWSLTERSRSGMKGE